MAQPNIMEDTMRLLATALLALALLVAPMPVLAHSGGTDAQGCHTDSSTGTRHCHSSGGSTGSGESSSGGSDISGEDIGLIIGLVGGLALIIVLVVCLYEPPEDAEEETRAEDEAFSWTDLLPDGGSIYISPDGDTGAAALSWRF